MKILKKIASTEIFKITSLNGVSVLLKICIGFITSKIIAIYVGPSGMALVGNLRNFTNSVESIVTLGFQNGIVKYVSDNKEDKQKVKAIFSVVFSVLFSVSIFLSFILFLFSDYWNFQIFGNHYEYSIVFKCLALLLPWYASSIFFLSFINGLGKYKKVIYINIIANFIGLITSVLLIIKFQTLGALLSIIVAPSVLFFVTYYQINKEINFFQSLDFKKLDFKIIHYLSSFSLMAFVSSVVGPIVFLAVRNYVIQTVGLQEAGYWEAITRISSYYLLFATTILSIYFLPKLSLAKNNHETKLIFLSFYKSILPIFVIGLIIIYFLRFYLVKILFTEEFLPVTSLFFWQLIGDVLKITSWILAFNLLAKKNTLVYVLTELFSLGLTYILSLIFINHYGIEGVVMAHSLTFLCYLIILVIYFRKSLV
ncbi:O-antigen translocase [Flavobacterium dankookense]|uniref:PST family polysaccharide transporter n=1 Tax=Flavobacterium dankookense TaxID=706186 RepID=A0A4R6QFD8_9FLAO|nr:O-antigen translocase [Flavobacterium dankookense]TDP60997.1 PST family polysaccharide transporter [Flavobacterium dankookense]